MCVCCAQEMNLRDLTKKVGRNKGLNVEAVQLFTCQLLIALRHLKKNQVRLHLGLPPPRPLHLAPPHVTPPGSAVLLASGRCVWAAPPYASAPLRRALPRWQQVLHADIKPDNILINHRHNKVKVCDFGSAMLAGENEITPYLVSRFYRPPEVVLGMKYGESKRAAGRVGPVRGHGCGRFAPVAPFKGGQVGGPRLAPPPSSLGALMVCFKGCGGAACTA